MTIIATIMTNRCTAHATDSLLTNKNSNARGYNVVENEKTKLVAVPTFRGIMSYWGLAMADGTEQWSTLSWLKDRAMEAKCFSQPEDFATAVADRLNQKLARMRLANQGIGIHFTAFEFIENCWIPELFLITNYKDPSYNQRGTVEASRRSYYDLCRLYRGMQDVYLTPEHRQTKYRLEVHQYLASGRILTFSNGDPSMFLPVLQATFTQLRIASERHALVENLTPRQCRTLVQEPIELVSRIQGNFFKPGYQMVGGKPHSLSVQPDGIYESDTGDNP